jgi:hypothetical protein
VTFLGVTLFEERLIGPERDPFMYRYILFRLPFLGVYLHHLMRSDYDRALHDHPWPFMTILLTGSYTEHTPQDTNVYRAGAILFRPALWLHRLSMERPMWTLVFVGRRVRRWGFMLPTGWCWWRKHNPELGICEEEILWTEGSD